MNSGQADWGCVPVAGLAVFPPLPGGDGGVHACPRLPVCRSVVGAREGSVCSLGV